MRNSPDALWSALRRHLGEEGLDPARCALGDFGPDDVSMYLGVLVDDRRRTYTFELFEMEGGTEFTLQERRTPQDRFPYQVKMYAASALLAREIGAAIDSALLVEWLEAFRRDLLEQVLGPDWEAFRAYLEKLGLRAEEMIPLGAQPWAAGEPESAWWGVLAGDGRCLEFAVVSGEGGPSRHGWRTRILDVLGWREFEEPEARAVYGEFYDAALRLLPRQRSAGSPDHPRDRERPG